MTIILEKPAVSEVLTLTVSVPMTFTRNMVAVAVDQAVTDRQVHPDELTPECIREALVIQLRVRGELDVEEDGSFLAKPADYPSDQLFMDAIFRAADRAFPELAPAVTA